MYPSKKGPPECRIPADGLEGLLRGHARMDWKHAPVIGRADPVHGRGHDRQYPLTGIEEGVVEVEDVRIVLPHAHFTPTYMLTAPMDLTWNLTSEKPAFLNISAISSP